MRCHRPWRKSAKRLRRASHDDLVGLGFSNRKAEYVLGLAEEPVDLEELAGLTDEEVKARLVAVRGLGEWTADWFLARHLARPRAWPAGDLREFGARFDPFQNLTAHYLLTGMRRVKSRVAERPSTADRSARPREKGPAAPDPSRRSGLRSS